MTTKRESWATSRDAVPAYVVQVGVYSETTGERIATVFRADAVPMIAAAPDLLAACEEVYKRLDYRGNFGMAGDPSMKQALMDCIRAALAKAKGE